MLAVVLAVGMVVVMLRLHMSYPCAPHAGAIHMSHLWTALPNTNRICIGKALGLKVWEMLNYSTALAMFGDELDSTGHYLLQLSGLRMAYNPQLKGTRLLTVDVWDRASDVWAPLQRLQLYSFAVEGRLCTVVPPFNGWLQARYLGEESGHIIDAFAQDVAVEYIKSLPDQTVNHSLKGRLVNSSGTQTMNWTQVPGMCRPPTYWQRQLASCVPCPTERDDGQEWPSACERGRRGMPWADARAMPCLSLPHV